MLKTEKSGKCQGGKCQRKLSVVYFMFGATSVFSAVGLVSPFLLIKSFCSDISLSARSVAL